MESKPKLHYFGFWARGEIIRFALAALGLDYEEVTVPSKLIDGAAGVEAWKAKRGEYEFCQLPMLEIDGKKLSQTRSILRYLF